MRALILALLAVLLAAGCAQEAVEEIKEAMPMKLTSIDFTQGNTIPAEYTCDGDNVSPELRIADVPEKAKSLALVVEDPDAPSGTFLHWALWNISPGTEVIPKGEQGFEQGVNDFGEKGYGGPCPPSGTHRYVFKLYALDIILELGKSAGRAELEKAMKGHILAEVDLMGTYKRR